MRNLSVGTNNSATIKKSMPSNLVIVISPTAIARRFHLLIMYKYRDNVYRQTNKILSRPSVEIMRGLNINPMAARHPKMALPNKRVDTFISNNTLSAKMKLESQITASMVGPKKIPVNASRNTFNGEVTALTI